MVRALPTAVLAALLACSLAFARTATLDVVDVQVLDGELIGIREGTIATRERLRAREQVSVLVARGTVGIAVTDRRFLAVSSSSEGWQETSLTLRADGESPSVELAANVALLITQSRILSFPSGPGEIFDQALASGEWVVDSGANEHVAAVVTNRRVLGFSSALAQPSDLSLHVREELVSMRVLATSVIVRTTERLLIYRHLSGGWSVEEV